MISIICPVYNEEDMLSKNSFEFKRLSNNTELIFADGGSTDRSVGIAGQIGIVIHSQKGRALQMNHAAAFAKGDMLLFLHADAFLSLNALASIEIKLMQNNIIGGCLTQRIDSKGLIYRIIETEGNIRAKITKIFYGDQGIFVRKDIFSKLGGFPEVPIMEDALFTNKLKRSGRTVVLPDKILVSPRRWKKKGLIRTAIFYSYLNILFWLGLPLNKIKLSYDDLR